MKNYLQILIITFLCINSTFGQTYDYSSEPSENTWVSCPDDITGGGKTWHGDVVKMRVTDITSTTATLEIKKCSGDFTGTGRFYIGCDATMQAPSQDPWNRDEASVSISTGTYSKTVTFNHSGMWGTIDCGSNTSIHIVGCFYSDASDQIFNAGDIYIKRTEQVQTCDKPTGLDDDYLTDNSVTLDWSSNNDVQDWDVRWKKTGYSWNYEYSITSSNKAISGLDCGTDHEFQVKANCDNGETSDWTNSYDFTTDNCPTPTVATPNISPNGGTFSSSQDISITCSTAGATIRYTTDGSTPTASSTVYSGEFSIYSTTTVIAKAFKSGYNASDTDTETFTKSPTPTVSTPDISPNSGTFSSSQNISITCSTTGATIRYTTDGSTPTASSTVYSGEFSIYSTTTVIAKAFKSGYNASDTDTETFTKSPTPTVSTPDISPNSGTFSSSQNISITCSTAGATIRYTTNGNTPTESSTIYSGEFTVYSTTTIIAKAFKSGYNASNTDTETFTKSPTPQVDTRIISLSGDINFGNIYTGESIVKYLQITNNGNSTLSVTSISCPTGFSGNWSGDIIAGGVKDVKITFAPTEAKYYSSPLTVNSNKTSGTNTVTVYGNGVNELPVVSSLTATQSNNSGYVNGSFSISDRESGKIKNLRIWIGTKEDYDNGNTSNWVSYNVKQNGKEISYNDQPNTGYFTFDIPLDLANNNGVKMFDHSGKYVVKVEAKDVVTGKQVKVNNLAPYSIFDVNVVTFKIETDNMFPVPKYWITGEDFQIYFKVTTSDNGYWRIYRKIIETGHENYAPMTSEQGFKSNVGTHAFFNAIGNNSTPIADKYTVQYIIESTEKPWFNKVYSQTTIVGNFYYIDSETEEETSGVKLMETDFYPNKIPADRWANTDKHLVTFFINGDNSSLFTINNNSWVPIDVDISGKDAKISIDGGLNYISNDKTVIKPQSSQKVYVKNVKTRSFGLEKENDFDVKVRYGFNSNYVYELYTHCITKEEYRIAYNNLSWNLLAQDKIFTGFGGWCLSDFLVTGHVEGYLFDDVDNISYPTSNTIAHNFGFKKEPNFNNKMNIPLLTWTDVENNQAILDLKETDEFKDKIIEIIKYTVMHEDIDRFTGEYILNINGEFYLELGYFFTDFNLGKVKLVFNNGKIILDNITVDKEKGYFKTNEVSISGDVYVEDLYDFVYFKNRWGNIAQKGAIISAGFDRSSNDLHPRAGEISLKRIYVTGKTILDGGDDGVKFNVKALSSLVNGAKIYSINKQDTVFVCETDYNGESTVNFIPNISGIDTFLVKHTNFEDIKFIINESNYEKTINIGMLPKETKTDSLQYYSLSLVNSSSILSIDKVLVTVAAKNMETYKYLSDTNYISQNALNNQFEKQLHFGKNLIHTKIEGSLDTVNLMKYVYYYPSDTINYFTNKLTINSSHKYLGTKVYADNEYQITLKENTSELRILKDTKVLMFTKKGYKPFYYWDIQNDTTITVELDLIETTEGNKTLAFSNQNIHYWNNITVKDFGKQSEINLQRLHEDVGFGLKQFSDKTVFTKQTNHNSKYRAYIAYDYVELPEKYFIVLIDNNKDVQKIFSKDYDETIVFEPEVQLLKLNSFTLNTQKAVVIVIPQAPVPNTIKEQTLLAGTSIEFSLSDLFSDPDEIPNDMQFDESGFVLPSGFTLQVVENKLIITCDSYTGKTELKVAALHDGLQAITTIPIKAENRPVVSDFEKSGNEDFDLFLTKPEFVNAFSDKDGDNLFSVKFETMPSGGVLYLNNSIVRPEQEIAVSQLSQLYFKPDKDWNGTIEYEYNANDGKYWAEKTAKVKLKINPVNDIPEFLIDQPYLLLDEDFANTVKVKVVQGFVPANEKNQTVSYVIDPETTPIANIGINKTTGEITISSIKNANGKQRFTVTAFDGEDSYEQAFNLEIKEVNNPPLFDLDYVEKTIKEDFEAFSLYAIMQSPPEDELGQNITWTALCENGQIIDIEVEEIYSLKCKITFKSKLNLNGLQEVTIKANDHQSENNFAYGKFNLTIEPVNDLPVFTIPADFQTITKSEDFDQPPTFSIVAGIVPNDENGQGVIYTVHSKNNKGIVSAEIDNMGKVTLTSIKDKFGEETFIVTANDNQAENNIFEQEFTVNVTPVNDAPEFSFVTPSNPDEDFIDNIYLSINPVADSWGEEQQKRTYTLKRKYPQNEAIINASISETTGKITFSSIKDHFGKETFIIVCNDGQAENNIVEKEFEITVNAVNDKQPFTLSGDLFSQEDFTNSMFVTVTPAERPWGEENEKLTYSIKANNNEFVKANINSSTGKTTITSVQDLFGQTEYTISCSDGTNVTTETFKVTIEPVNDATKFTLSGNVNVKEDFEGKQTVYVNKENPAFGEENQINKFSIVNIEAITAANISIDENTGEISISSLQDRYTEPIEITVRCDDGQVENSISEQRFTLKVESVNDSPEFSVNNNIVMQEDQGNSATSTMSIVPKRWGEENENYKFSFKHSHNLEFAVLLIDEKTGKLTVSTQKDIFGEYDVDIICDDGQSKTIQTVRISIAPVNDIPVIYFVDEIIEDEDFTGVPQIMAKHKDKPWGETNETYSYRLKNGFSTEAADIEINSSTGEVSVKSIKDRFGVNVLVPVVVSDGELESTATFVLTVNPVNDIPTFNLSNYELFTYQDFTESITIDALNLSIPWGEDNQKHRFTITPSNFDYANIEFDSDTGQTKISSIEGKYTDGKKQFTVKVDDGESENNTFEQTFTLEIKKLVIRKETELRLSYNDINRYNWSEFFDFPEFATNQIQFRLIKEQSSSNLILSPNSDVEVILSENFGQKDYGWFTVEAVYRGEIIKVQVMVYHESYTGIAEDLEKQIIVYPNPVGKANILMVKVPQSLQIEDISLVNIQGQKLKAIVENSETIKFDLSNIASGALFIRIETNKGIITKKIIK